MLVKDSVWILLTKRIVTVYMIFGVSFQFPAIKGLQICTWVYSVYGAEIYYSAKHKDSNFICAESFTRTSIVTLRFITLSLDF